MQSSMNTASDLGEESYMVTHVIKSDDTTIRDTKSWKITFKNPCKDNTVTSEFEMTFSDST